MNDHLIKNCKIDFLLRFLASLFLVSLLILLFNKIKPTEWYIWLLYLIYPVYSTFNEEKIILEVLMNDENVTIKSYSILKGKKEVTIAIKDIIKIDFFNGFSIKYKNTVGKTKDIFKINAEPWNTLYTQIKTLKLAHQDEQLQKAKDLTIEMTK
ncbi:hypothetical protein [uncultured Dokdonia sp.]|uniref:hypothetical protein n=1 Tax=uncultured Dokdonia sp. TaxID=575653 RepID=UPI00260A1E29|nr:hypothetical protein [uncultured Dokdonia sp.]